MRAQFGEQAPGLQPAEGLRRAQAEELFVHDGIQPHVEVTVAIRRLLRANIPAPDAPRLPTGSALAFNGVVRKRTELPVALTIAGSDSGGGAGVQADLKTFAALGIHGTSAITCVTAQNPAGVSGIEACSSGIVRAQIEAVFSDFPVRAAKTGMLFSAEIIRAVARSWYERRCPLVVDPVMVATSGASLLQPDAVRALTARLFPLATLLTPNLPEAAALLGMRIREPEELRTAARALHQRYGCAVLVKGGHLSTKNEAIDIFYDGQIELLLSAPRIRGVRTHGTGCTYSAAIAALLARGKKLEQAVQMAKTFVSLAIANSVRSGKHDVLNLGMTAPRNPALA